MSMKEYMDIILGVIKSPYVIATVIAMILVIKFAKYVASYKKKPPKPKGKKGQKKTATIEAKPKEEESGEGDGATNQAASS